MGFHSPPSLTLILSRILLTPTPHGYVVASLQRLASRTHLSPSSYPSAFHFLDSAVAAVTMSRVLTLGNAELVTSLDRNDKAASSSRSSQAETWCLQSFRSMWGPSSIKVRLVSYCCWILKSFNVGDADVSFTTLDMESPKPRRIRITPSL